MGPLTITIPDTQLEAFVDKIVASGNYPSADAYVAALIKDDRRRRTESLKQFLRDGLASEAHEMTDADWDEMFRQYDQGRTELQQP